MNGGEFMAKFRLCIEDLNKVFGGMITTKTIRCGNQEIKSTHYTVHYYDEKKGDFFSRDFDSAKAAVKFDILKGGTGQIINRP